MTQRETLAVTMVPAVRSDVDRIVAIEQTAFTAPWTRKMFEAELTSNPFSQILVARIPNDDGDPAGELAGYVCFWVVFEELRLMNLAVTPAVRRQGIGRALLQRALALGHDGGGRRALLEVRASNVAALALYAQIGFRQNGRRAGYYSRPVEDAVLMELDLLPDG